MEVRFMSRSQIGRLARLSITVVLLHATLAAQTSRGTVTGLVTDAQKAAVPGAKVELTGIATNVTRTTQTNESGLYRFDAVDPGPYKLTEWEHDRYFKLEKNDGYWDAKNLKVNTVIRPIIGTQTNLLAYENDEIDWVDRAPLGELKRIQADPKLSKELIQFSLVGTWYLVPHVQMAPFDNKQVRLAMAGRLLPVEHLVLHIVRIGIVGVPADPHQLDLALVHPIVRLLRLADDVVDLHAEVLL